MLLILEVVLRNHLDGLLNLTLGPHPQILQIWGRAWEFAFPAGSQVILILVCGPSLNSIAVVVFCSLMILQFLVVNCLPVKICHLLFSLTFPSPKIRNGQGDPPVSLEWFIPYSEGPMAWMPFWIGIWIMESRKFYLWQNFWVSFNILEAGWKHQ